MSGIKKRKLAIRELEKRLMLDASLGALVSTTVFAENTVNASPQILDADVTISGTTTNFDGESLTISTTGGAEDQISINNEGSGAGQIGFDGTNVSYGGTVIGTISSNGTNGSNLTIDLDSDANQAALERLIENITYQNISDNPASNRTLNYSVGALFSENITVTVVGQNEGPSIDTNAGITLNEGATQTITSAELGISDPDNNDTNVTFTVDTNVTKGRLELSTNAGVAISSFTLDDLNSGLLRYVHSGSETTSDNFAFTVSDGSLSSTGTFNITITPVNDTPSLITNTGTSVFQGLETTIGANEVSALFGTEILRRSGVGEFSTFQNDIDGGVNSQISIIFTTPATPSTATPGQVIYETGGSGRGIGLYLNSANELAWHIGPATYSPRMTSGGALSTNTQYAVVMEIDSDNDEVRMHYQAAGNFNWFEFGRTAEVSMIWSDNDNSGGNGSGLGQVGSNSYGGFTGSTSGNTDFQGTIDSDLVITRFPSGGTTFINTKLIATDPDSSNSNLVYTITTNVQDGTLFNDDVALGLNDTFTQDDLDNGLITYSHGGAADNADSFIFSVSDGNTSLLNQTYNITIDLTNNAPILPDQILQINEDAANNNSVGTLSATDSDVGQTLTYSILGGTGAGIFDIDTSTGKITVLDNSTLDYETTTSYTLSVRVSDNGPSPLFADRTFTIDILDVNENTAPNFPAQPIFNINEDANTNDIVGTVSATDPEGDVISYSITNGNTGNIFKINSSTGVISINNASNLDFETRNSYTLTITATDDDVIPLSTNRNVTITINDVNEAPSFAKENVIYYLDPSVQYSSATDNFYKYYNNNINFATALDNADNIALNGTFGYLVTITSAAENSFIDSIIGNHIWIAASDAGTEGKWIWIAGPEAGQQFSQGGSAVNSLYENWNGSEPNSGSSNNYAYMNTNGTWYDQTGNESRRYVIEWEGSDVINNNTYIINHANPDASDLSNGTSIGYIQAGDADGNGIAYSIASGNSDGIFEVDTTTGEIRILDNSNLDASLQDTYVLTVRATETGAGGLYDETNITINFNNSLSLTTNTPLAVNEAGNAIIDTSVLNVTDADTAPADIIYTITDQPDEGRVAFASSPGVQINSFTQDDLDNNRVIYVHGGSETTTDSFEFSVTDGASTSSGNLFNLNVNPQNDSPAININTGTNVNEGGTRTITAAMLNSLDADDADTDLIFTASNILNGSIEVSGSAQNTFTQADINAGNVVFRHDGSENNGRFNITLADGGEDGALTANAVFNLTRNPVNDSPTITVNNGATVTEGSTVTIGSANLSANDVDDTNSSLVYTLSVIVNGQVELSTNPNVPIISFTQNDLDNNRVVFRHDGSENVGRFNFSVADGGEDGATPATGTFTFNVHPVNDSPLITTANNTTVDTANTVLIKKAVLNATDPDDSGAGLIYTVDSTTNGQLELLSNPNVAITTFTQADVNNSQLVFRHDGTATLTAQFQVTLADGGEDGAGTDSATINLAVNNTNDSPTITLNAGATIDEGASLTLNNTMLDSFDPDDTGTGLIWSVSNVSVNGQLELSNNPGVAITSFTQADLDNGLVTFIHDGSETTSASFDLELADGGENSATTDTTTFNITVTPVNEAPNLVISDGSPTIINFNDYTINSYDNSQDNGPLNLAINDGGATLYMEGNGWKKINLNYVVTANTILTLDFRSTNEGEIHGIGFETDDIIQNEQNKFQFFGTQTWSQGAQQTYNTYSLGDGWVRYEIPVGNTFTGSQTNLVFFMDHDGSPKDGVAEFRNVTIYENGAGEIHVSESGNTIITTSNLTGVDVDDNGTGLTFSVSNLVGGQIELSTNLGVAVNSFTQDDLSNNRVIFAHDGSEGTTASFDVELADGGENGAGTQSGTVTLIVDPLNDAPIIATNTGATMNEGASLTLTNSMLNEGDPDDDGRNVTYSASNLSNGIIQVNGSTQNSFTQFDIDRGLVTFIHDGSETLTASFVISLADGGENGSTPATGTFNITVTPINDEPNISTNIGASLNEGGNVTIINSMLNSTDPDDGPAGLTYTASNLTNGHIEVNGSTQSTFTQADINAGNVVFVHDGSETLTASFDISVADGGEDSASAATGTFNLTVTPLNDAPTIATNTGATMNEGASLTLTNTMLNEGDPDDDGADVTYTASNLVNGHIEVIGSAQSTFTQADINAENVVFIHDDSQTTSASFGISLADGGENGSTPATGTFNIIITPVNDAPIIANNAGTTLNEGGAQILTNAMLSASDVDNADGSLIYTINSLSAGIIENTNTALALNIGDTFLQSDIDNGFIRYTHDGRETLSETMQITVTDGALSTSMTSFGFTITPINDAPTDISMSADTIPEDMSVGTPVGTLAAMDPDLPGDSFIYNLIDDAGGMFAIAGNQLMLMQPLDFRTSSAHDIIVQVNDNNGGTFNRSFTINVTEVRDDGFFIAPDNINKNTDRLSSFEGRKLDDIFSVSDITNPESKFSPKGFIRAALNGLDNFKDIFYGQKTTIELSPRGLSENLPSFDGSENNDDAPAPQQNKQELLNPAQEEFTNIRQILMQLDNMNSDDNDPSQNDDINSLSALEQEFEDVLTYHEMKKAKLREALLDS